MKNKKLAILAAICLVTSMAAVTTACKPNSTPSVVYEVSIDLETVDMKIGETKQLTSTYTTVAGVALAYASSDTSVATVDATGNITAVGKGTATITATYGTATDTCVVTVGLQGEAPTLVLPSAVEAESEIGMTDTLDLNGTVSFGDKSYDDATFSFDVADPTVGAVVDGVFVPAAAGTTTVTITASWRGVTVMDAPTLMQTVTITVRPSWDWSINGEKLYDATLYTQAAEGYANTMPFVVVAAEGDEALETTISVTKGAGLLTYDATAQTLTTTGTSGKATVIISTEVQGEPVTMEIIITILPTIYEYTETVANFSAIHGDVAVGKSLKEIFGETLVSAYAEDGTPLEVRANKVYGVESSKDGEFNATITVCSLTKGYEMQISGYSGIFAKAQDLEVFYTNADAKGESGREPIDASSPMQVWDGYYVLANNIDASEYEHQANGKNLGKWGIDNSYPFGLVGGVFDGQGYTIKGITFNEFGLFGYVINSTIKNVAFTEVTLNNVAYTTVLAQWIQKSTVSNVYVSIATEKVTKAYITAFANGIQDSTVEACVIETKSTFEMTNKPTGVFMYENRDIYGRSGAASDYSKFKATEIYVLSKVALGMKEEEETVTETVTEVNPDTGLEETKDVTKEVTIYKNLIAENETAGTAENNKYYQLTGVKRYVDRTEMTNATGNTFEKFNSFWTITNGTPVWNTADDDFAPPVADEEVSDVIVGDFNPDWVK